ncbi:MAG: hypothetical protein V1734_00595 [Nanoarchaeota archaeon]
MATTNKLSDCYSIGSRIEIKEEDYYYSKLELAATGLSSDSAVIPGIQARIYSGFRNSILAGEIEGYPVETVIRINPLSEDYAAQVFGGNSFNRFYNVKGLQEIVNRLDTTTSKEFKLFAGYDGRRWDFIANMDAKKAVLYIKNSVNPVDILDYLAPFIPDEIKRQVISEEIEQKHKAGAR